MPRGDALKTEREAVEIVRQEEIARGWSPGPPLSKSRERIEGCDFFSYPADGGPPHPIEVKGWGEPLLTPGGSFTYGADINAQQFERARRDPRWRLEIVGNLTAARTGSGAIERLSLTAAEVIERAQPWRFSVPLDGLRRVFPIARSSVPGAEPAAWRTERRRPQFAPPAAASVPSEFPRRRLLQPQSVQGGQKSC
jgi:hypothetical protein